MIQNLDLSRLLSLIETVFKPSRDERSLTIFVDLPSTSLPDTDCWKDRRKIAVEWFRQLRKGLKSTAFTSVNLCCYENVGSNNGDLPATVVLIDNLERGVSLNNGVPVPLENILKSSSVVISLTKLSATAPLKILAKSYGFRGATLPGFTRDMIPILQLDFEKVNARVLEFKNRMDKAEAVVVRFLSDESEHVTSFDLRFRAGYASGGLMREKGVVGNLPSGEAYIVPYEGERIGEPSKTSGMLPVQFDNELVLYKIEANRAIEVVSSGRCSELELRKLADEPAYGNIAEVGIGVLGEWGVKSIGSTLLDEKLGLHIAFGRSDHFGGVTSAASFRNPKNVIHIDRVYVPSVQPLINVAEVTFHYPDGVKETILRSGQYIV
jgi:hypothetical protein